MKQLMDEALVKQEKQPLVFMLGTGLEIRNSLETEFYHKACYERLFAHYLSKQILSEEDLEELKNGSKRIVTTSKIQEVACAVGAVAFYESSFLPGELKLTMEDLCQIGSSRFLSFLILYSH